MVPRGTSQTGGKFLLPSVWRGPDAYGLVLSVLLAWFCLCFWTVRGIWAGRLRTRSEGYSSVSGQFGPGGVAVWHSRDVDGATPAGFFVKPGVLPRLLCSDEKFRVEGR
jgi:hypothetical protein